MSNEVRGSQVDPMTVFLGVTVDCNTKTVQYGQLVLSPEHKLRHGWRDRLEKQWSKAYCKSDSFSAKAIRSGWSVSSTVKTQDGHLYRVDALCYDATAGLTLPTPEPHG